jgi:putative ABC transport system permease protein
MNEDVMKTVRRIPPRRWQRPYLWLINFIGLIVPRRLRADWRQEWEAELRNREALLTEWEKLDWQNKLDLLRRGFGAFWDALMLQPKRLEDEMFQDLRYGVRMLLKSKRFTAVAALSLALGIGANTAIFSLIDAVLLKMLPVERPEQLYLIATAGSRGISAAPPYPCFERFRDHNQSFTGLAAFGQFKTKITIDGQLEEVHGQRVSGNYFSLLGVRPVLGRTLTSADDSIPGRGGPDGIAAVISYNYWTRRFGRNPEVIGNAVQIGNHSVMIVGVTPPDFYGLFPGVEVNISVPMMIEGARLTEKDDWWFRAVGRLKPGVGLEQARAELDTIFQSYMNETSIMTTEGRRDYRARIELPPASKGLDTLRRRFSRPLQALMAIVALVLLIACANVANLLLARATARRKEFAVRLAMGASRLRLVRQLLTESLLLVSLGGLLGLLIARWGSSFLAGFFATGPNRIFVDLPLDGRVMLFTFIVALFTGLIFGLAPALQATRVDPSPTLKDSAGTSTSARTHISKLLVIAQVAFSLLLLVGAGLFLRTLHNLKSIDAGFQTEGVLTMRINPLETAYQGSRLNNLWKEILNRVEKLPGVRTASLSTFSPLDGGYRENWAAVSGFTPRSELDKRIRVIQVSSGFFKTMGLVLRQGRVLTEDDNETAPRVALINEAAARFYFGERNPLGGQITPFYRPNADETFEIVGVVKDARYDSLREPDSRRVYLPLRQSFHRVEQLTLAVRTLGNPTALTNAIRNEIEAAGTDILLTNIMTLNEQVDQSLLQERLVSTLSLSFGLLALLLASIGLYGVISYDVARRTHEIGIRMPLGAQGGDVLRMVLRETMLLVVIGLVIGLAAALATTKLIESLLFGLKATDPLIFSLATLLFMTVAALSGWLPARRAARVDPMVALRHE